MALEIVPVKVPGLWPITAEAGSIKIAGRPFRELIAAAFGEVAANRVITVQADFLPSAELVQTLNSSTCNVIVKDVSDGAVLAKAEIAGVLGMTELSLDAASFRLRHPWDVIALNEKLVGALTENEIYGTVRTGVTLDGFVKLGKNSVILPGVYIEGNVVIGENCKIGPNCYIRGNTSIGDRCHVGQAVEIKNCVLGDKVSVGHLSYAGDSVICNNVNFGAGTIISNLRHDGRNHRWQENSELVDTGRRKFGAIIGENVHTGIHTSIYPGRSLSEGSMTLPGEVVSRSK